MRYKPAIVKNFTVYNIFNFHYSFNSQNFLYAFTEKIYFFYITCLFDILNSLGLYGFKKNCFVSCG